MRPSGEVNMDESTILERLEYALDALHAERVSDALAALREVHASGRLGQDLVESLGILEAGAPGASALALESLGHFLYEEPGGELSWADRDSSPVEALLEDLEDIDDLGELDDFSLSDVSLVDGELESLFSYPLEDPSLGFETPSATPQTFSLDDFSLGLEVSSAAESVPAVLTTSPAASSVAQEEEPLVDDDLLPGDLLTDDLFSDHLALEDFGALEDSESPPSLLVASEPDALDADL